MSLNQPIVVGTDGSTAATNAVRWAARQSRIHNLPLRIVTALDGPPQYWGDFALPSTYIAESTAHAKERLAEAQRIAVEGGAHSITTDVLTGFAHVDLITESKNAHTLVLGSRGLSAVKANIIGSVTHSVASYVHSPLVVVHDLPFGWDRKPLAPVVVGVDGSEHNRAAVDAAFKEADRLGTELIAVHAWSDTALPRALSLHKGLPWADLITEEEARLAESLAGWKEQYPDVDVRRVVIKEKPARYLAELSSAASLVVVGSRGRGGFAGMLLGSTSRSLLHSCQCPLMTVPGDR
ncbi:universal stress protein [Hoyosella rhizosphaerae]|uniref:Universal stress protein n=1 Tax=Hoyosella rhizosphaerae TaxID=1755582 RepID=A0A916UAL3_9ACTN|nr:universal stress protein [Hoyosella rhizosphaerae]MBN4926057.1 universal stress protein [Hoyosella rhizosphaerae]GGC65884.1 universal stress protein [Hoyosella rhizosphaerae]